MRRDVITIDLAAKAREIAACPKRTAQVRNAISGAVRDLMLDEIGARRRLSSSVEKK
ncbi:hypothetical protein D9M71_543430 [compost metagenome]